MISGQKIEMGVPNTQAPKGLEPQKIEKLVEPLILVLGPTL